MLSSLFQGVQPQRISPISSVVFGVDLKVQITVQRPLVVRVFAGEPTGAGIEIPRPHKVEARFSIELTSREAEWVGQRAAGRSLVSERVECIGLGERAGCVPNPVEK